MLAVQAKKFTSLEGTQEAQGDLKVHTALVSPRHAHPHTDTHTSSRLASPCCQSVVLHSMKLQHVKSSFPLAVGAEISAVDNDCFSATGKAYSFIALADAESSSERTLQEDDVRCNPHAAPPSRAPLLLTCLSLVYR